MQSQLYELCGQFEQIFVASLVPQSVFGAGPASSESEPDDTPVESGTSAALFTQAFAAALVHAGGLGLGREMYSALSEPRA